ncbi:MAG: class I SAM-dependent DNA methyltransferase [Gammaproteobacteria bacterium]|nr:class I SAM-dependent DNA methyltransferase [Gammaproteobacteria bacterium]
MNITQLEGSVKELVNQTQKKEVSKDDFLYHLMALYGHRKTTIGRIKSGERNLASVPGEIRVKRHIYFKHCHGDSVLSDIDNMKKEPSVAREKIRFVIATDFNQFVALDTRTNDTLDIEFNDLGKHFDFFLPWAGMEKAVYQGENPADVKAAEKMAKLFDVIKADNFNDENKHDKQALHNLNIFLTRLLFCFFAEDTGIFKQNQFSGELESHTKVDGSDVAEYLNRLFEVLNTPKNKRADLPDYLANFEFVNGGLFADNIASPRFSTKSRKMLIECGSELDWSDINPDIFGSMIQAVVHPDQRGNMGMHYTSVTNIMKIIEPLFLDELYAELENIEDNIDQKLKPSRLRKLHDRIVDIKIFDPACGSGNFLIIAFKELRKIEMEIIKRIQELDTNQQQDDLFLANNVDYATCSKIKLTNFYGIELDDFAHEVAILSLWLAEHQMNVEFKAEFGDCDPSLPLKASGNIVSGNALTINWLSVCPNDVREIYIIGNPPYIGARKQTPEQKEDMERAFYNENNFKTGSLDYIAGWFLKGANYLKGSQKLAFVSTSSISQGEQVSFMWDGILRKNVEIILAIPPFKWTNNAKKQAGVYCVIIGLGPKGSSSNKKILLDSYWNTVEHINPYLTSSQISTVKPRTTPISPQLPKMGIGNKPVDGGGFLFTESEKTEFVTSEPTAKLYFRKWFGAQEFNSGVFRWCLSLQNVSKDELGELPKIRKVIDEVKNFRLSSSSKPTIKLAETPQNFHVENFPKSDYIIIPKVSSSVKEYIPVGLFKREYLASDLLNVVESDDLFFFGLLSSKIHLIWTTAVSGKFGNGIRYSSKICYNTFPVPSVSEEQKDKVRAAALNVLLERESYSDLNISKLYSEQMPISLKKAHLELDREVELLYSPELLSTEEQKLNLLFNLYSKMTGGHNA